MARTARWSAPGHVFHLVSRFAWDEWWLDRAGAREAYLSALGKAAGATDAVVLGYCLMSNHVHLVVVQGEEGLERLAKSVHTAFATWVRQHAGRRGKRALGPVFAGRPRMVLVDRDAYLLELLRYVHNNPVRAGVARRARESAWSSHRAYVGKAPAPDWLRVGYVLDRFGRRVSTAQRKLDEFVDAGRRQPRQPALSGVTGPAEAAEVRRQFGDGYRVADGIVGDEAFIARVRADVKAVESSLSARGTEQRRGAVGRPTLRELWEAVLEHLEIDVTDFELRPRAAAHVHAKRLLTWLWVREYEGRQIEVARLLGITTAAVSGLYAGAVRAAGTYDQEGSAIAVQLASKRRARKATRAREGSSSVRYFVDVHED